MTNTTALDLDRAEFEAWAMSGASSIPAPPDLSRLGEGYARLTIEIAWRAYCAALARAALAAKGQQEPVAKVSPAELRDIQSGLMAVPVRSNNWRDDQTISLYLAAPVAQQSEACDECHGAGYITALGRPTEPCDACQASGVAGQQSEAGDLSERVLHAIYKCCQRGDSPERLHKAVMGLLGEAGAPTAAARIDDEWLELHLPERLRISPEVYTSIKLLVSLIEKELAPTSGRESAAPAAPVREGDGEQDAKDAARYRWLRGSATDIGNVIDKEFAPGKWEYRAGEELDEAVDAAMQKGTQQ